MPGMPLCRLCPQAARCDQTRSFRIATKPTGFHCGIDDSRRQRVERNVARSELFRKLKTHSVERPLAHRLSRQDIWANRTWARHCGQHIPLTPPIAHFSRASPHLLQLRTRGIDPRLDLCTPAPTLQRTSIGCSAERPVDGSRKPQRIVSAASTNLGPFEVM